MSRQYTLFANDLLQRRQIQLNELILAVVDPEEYPFYMSDQATLYDVSTDDEQEIKTRFEHHYRIPYLSEYGVIPIWKLLDRIQQELSAN